MAYAHYIAYAHYAGGHPNPCDAPAVREVVRGIRRTLGVGPKQASALTLPRLGMVLHGIDRGTVRGKRDAALLTLGFALAARRSELVALDVEDLEDDGDGLFVRIARLKSDQEGQGALLYDLAARPCSRGGGRSRSAADFYEMQQLGVGEAFLRALDEGFARIQRHPKAFRIEDLGVRTAFLQHHPRRVARREPPWLGRAHSLVRERSIPGAKLRQRPDRAVQPSLKSPQYGSL